MAVHLVTFRLDNGPDYSDRWNSLVDALRALADDGITWEETTSVFILKSPLSAADLLEKIWISSSLNKTRDKCVVINLSYKLYAAFGCEYPHTLNSLMAAR